jgi:hypothetical protein
MIVDEILNLPGKDGALGAQGHVDQGHRGLRREDSLLVRHLFNALGYVSGIGYRCLTQGAGGDAHRK